MMPEVSRPAHAGFAGAAGAGVAALASAQGGFFPTSWGWAALAFSLVAALGLLLAERVVLSRVELAFLGLVAAYVGWTALSILWSVDVSNTVDGLQRAL